MESRTLKKMNKKHKTQRIAIYLVVLTTFFTSLGQIFFKYAAKTFEFDFFALITNYYLILGFFFYGLSAIALLMGLKRGELSTLYPIIALSYVWVTIASVTLFAEALLITEILGILLIIGGVAIMGVANSE